MLDKITLLSLGIRPDTDPNNPETWSDELKINHKRTLQSLGSRADDIAVKPKGKISGKSGSFKPSTSKNPETGALSGDEIRQESERIKTALSQIDNSDLEKDGVPKGVNATVWNSASDKAKKLIKKYIQSHREFMARHQKNGQLPLESDLSESAGDDLSTLYDNLADIQSALGEESYKRGERHPDQEEHFVVNPTQGKWYQERAVSDHKEELGRVKSAQLFASTYPLGFTDYDRTPMGMGAVDFDNLSAPIKVPTIKLKQASSQDLKQEQETAEAAAAVKKPQNISDEELDSMEEMDDYECDTCGEPAIGYDEEDGYQCKSCYKDTHGTSATEEKPEEESTSQVNDEAKAEQDKAVEHLTNRIRTFGPKTTTAAVLKGALDRVQSGMAGSKDEERARITDILNDELSKQKKGSIMYAHLELAAKKYAEDIEPAPTGSTVQDQNQAQTESGNALPLSTPSGAPVGKGEAFQQPTFATPQPLKKCAFCEEEVPAQAAHTINEDGICSKAATYLAAPGYHKDSRDSWLSQVGIYPESGELHINGEIRANNARGTLNNEKNQAETESGSNVSAQMTEAGVAPSQQSTEEPEASSYTGPGSVEYANKEDAPTSGGVMPDGSAPTWKDVHIAITNGTRRGSTPGAKRYIKKVAPDLGGHVLDIADTFYAIQDHPGFTEEARKSSIDEIKSNVQPIYDWLKGKAESTPDEVATGLPRSLRQDQMISDYQGIIARKNTKVDESTGLSKEAQDVYAQSANFAEKAKEEAKLGPADVRYERARNPANNDSGRNYGTSRSDMTSEQYEAWAAQKKSEGWTDWKAEKPMSSEDLAAQKKAASESRTKSVRIPKAGSSYSSTLPKEQRFDTDLRPTNVDKDHWTALKTYRPEAAAFVSMYVHKWHNLVDSGTIAPEGKMSTGEAPRYTVDQLKSDKQAVLSMFNPRDASVIHNRANNDKLYKMAPLLSKTKLYQGRPVGLVDTDHDAADRINHILRAYPIPE
jgi:hypothetical protein